MEASNKFYDYSNWGLTRFIYPHLSRSGEFDDVLEKRHRYVIEERAKIPEQINTAE